MATAELDHQSEPPIDLTDCDREPIHQIGAIQPIGFLIAVSRDWLILRVSANTAGYFGRPVAELIGIPLGKVISRQAIHLIGNRLALLHGANAVERAFAVQLWDGEDRFDLAVHITGQTIVIEAEPSQPEGDLNAGGMVRSMLARMQGQVSLVREAARLMKGLTGFDRVMIYRFHPDGSGEVIAERVNHGVEPFLGLRYPAEDIPRQARELLIRNPVRLLADVAGEPSPIVPQLDASNEPLDLSMSVLRAHSTMHIEYLMNMGVGATMTISLVRDGKLWGLISCHHMTARHVGLEMRTTAELFGQMLSFLIERREREDLAANEARTRQLQDQLIATVVERGSEAKNIVELADRMARLVPCDGIVVCVDGTLTLKGATPTHEQFVELQSFLARVMEGQIFATDDLGKTYSPARDFVEHAAGMLVVPISRSPRDYLVLFRHEMARAVVWAGQPDKVLVTGPHGTRLTPRKSFEAWREVVRGRSALWTEAELRSAEMLRVTLLEAVLHNIGLTEKESRAASRKQELLIAELNHRVRNILGLIRGLVTQSQASAADVETFATVLGDRVHALARAHDQITAKNWGPGSLATLIATEAAAFLGDGAVRIHANGPTILLQPQAFSTIALVIHELITNAAKHGALANPEGQITIEWAPDSTGAVVLDWIEAGGPPVGAPTRRGFGSTIIQHSVPHELGGEAKVDYAAAGLRARFVVPAEYAVVDEDPGTTVFAVVTPGLPGRLAGQVLLVEDNLIIALDAEDMLMSLGAENVAVARNVAEALRLIELTKPTFALLDINLGPETSWPVATRLRELGVPHIFATGYGDGIEYPLEHNSTPSITKPYTSASVAQVISETNNAGL